MKELRRPRQLSLQTVQLNSLRTPGQSVLTGPQPEESEAVPTDDDAQLPEIWRAQLPETQPEPGSEADYHYIGKSMAVLTASYKSLRDEESKKQMIKASVALYEGLNPQNALEAALGATCVALTNSALGSFARGTDLPPECSAYKETEVRLGIRAAHALAELAKTLESIRGKRGNVQVGTVNVEAGGQAIVGTVETGVRADSDIGQSAPAKKKSPT